MNEAAQRLLPAGLLTLALHSAFLSWQMENRPIELPKPEKISVTLRQPPPPPPPPPQQRIVKELLPPPELKPVERQPLETLPPPQSKVVKRRKPLPEVIKQIQHKPLEQLPPAQSRIARRMPPPPTVAAAALRPLETLPPALPAQGRILRPLPRLHDTLAISQPTLKPLETLPPVQEEVFAEVFEEELVQTEPVHEEIVEEYSPPPVEDFVEVIEEQEQRRQRDYVPPQPQPARQRQAESSFASSGAGDQEAAPLYASNPPPEYPMQARRRGLQGVVILEALVDANGSVSDLRLFASSGHSILDKAALSSDPVMNRRFLQPNSAAMVLAALSSVSPFVAGTVTTEQTDAGPPKLMNEVVVTGTRTPHALKDVPVETTVVSRQDIQQSNAQNVMDVLKTVPGIDSSVHDASIR